MTRVFFINENMFNNKMDYINACRKNVIFELVCYYEYGCIREIVNI